MSARVVLMLLIGAAPVACAVHAQDILIRGATVHTVSEQGTLSDADVLVRAGRIAAVGSRLEFPAGAEVIEAKGRPLTPGFFAGLSGIGIAEVPAEASTRDASASFGAPAWQQRWRPEFDVTLAYNPRSTVVPVSRIEGLTWTMLTPWGGDSIVSGQGAAVSLDGRQDAVLNQSRTLFVSWSGSSAASGGSKAALYMLFEQAIGEARERRREPGDLLLPAGRTALRRYLDGGRVVFDVDRATDIRRLVEFARSHGIRPVINGGAEAWLVADELARAGVPVILNPLLNLPQSFDSLGARLDNAALLERAGVKIAISPGDIHNARKIRQLAGNAVAHGLPWEAALAAVTANPAEIFGLGAARGRVAAGQAADLVLWSADPLEVTSRAEHVWIAGKATEMRSRQTDLRDRYSQRSPTR